MKNCPHCHAPLADEAVFCVYCMHELVPKKEPSRPVSRRRGIKMLLIAGAVSLTVIAASLTALILFLHFRASAAQPGTDVAAVLNDGILDPGGAYRFGERSDATEILP